LGNGCIMYPFVMGPFQILNNAANCHFMLSC
jgi:hypothetical protein